MNARAPVRAWTKEDLSKTRDFKTMADFEAWYRPSHHGDHHRRVNSQYLFTDVLLDCVDDASPSPSGNRPPKGASVTRAGITNTRSGVIVNGTSHGSVFRAFEALGLPIKAHQKFRKELKIAGALDFEHEGKVYHFKNGA